MNESLVLRNNVAEVRRKQNISQAELANMVGVSRNTISSIETGQYQPTAKLALLLCVALDKKFEDLFYFWWTKALICKRGFFIFDNKLKATKLANHYKNFLKSWICYIFTEKYKFLTSK